MLKKNIFAAALALSCAVISASASAESYFGGTVGRAKWNVDCTGTNACTTSSTGYKLFLGYEFTPVVSFEGAYVSMNEVTARVGNLSAGFTGRGLDMAAVFKAPAYKDFQAFGKLGVSYLKGEITATMSGVSAADNRYSTQGLVGFGVLYNIDKKVALRAEFDHRRVKVSGFDDTTFNSNMLSIGVQSVF